MFVPKDPRTMKKYLQREGIECMRQEVGTWPPERVPCEGVKKEIESMLKHYGEQRGTEIYMNRREGYVGMMQEEEWEKRIESRYYFRKTIKSEKK